jgi:hypothetical protein
VLGRVCVAVHAVGCTEEASHGRCVCTHPPPPSPTEMVYLCMYSAVILNGDLRNPAIRPAWKMTRCVPRQGITVFGLPS